MRVGWTTVDDEPTRWFVVVEQKGGLPHPPAERLSTNDNGRPRPLDVQAVVW